MKKDFDVVNVIRCKGAACISLNSNIRKYYASNIKHRVLKPKMYKYEKS